MNQFLIKDIFYFILKMVQKSPIIINRYQI